MAHVDVEINFNHCAEALHCELKVGYKRATLTGADFVVEADIIDFDEGTARATWITTTRGGEKTYKDVVEELQRAMEAYEHVRPVSKFERLRLAVAHVNVEELEGLTEREQAIAKLAQQGMELEEIAQTLCLARATVEEKIRGRGGKPGLLAKLGA